MSHGVRPDALEHGALEDINTLRHFPGNARLHDDELLTESLAINGQYKPIIAQTSSRYVIAGNGTMAAARALGWTEVLVAWLECDDEQARRINLVDNRASDKARDDIGALVELLGALGGDLAGTGFSHDDHDAMLKYLEAPLTYEPDVLPPEDHPTDHHKTVTQCPSCGHLF